MESCDPCNVEAAPHLSALSFFCPLGPHGVHALKGRLCHKVFCLALRCFHALKISIGKWNFLRFLSLLDKFSFQQMGIACSIDLG